MHIGKGIFLIIFGNAKYQKGNNEILELEKILNSFKSAYPEQDRTR